MALYREVFRTDNEHTLLVDGTAAVDGDDLLLSPTWAVLHKPAGSDHGPAVAGGCG